MRNFERLAPFSEYRVGSLVPKGFKSYARIFHPAWLSGPKRTTLRWADMASHSGAKFHPSIQWDEISAPAIKGLKVEPPDSGTLPGAVSQPLREILSGHCNCVEIWLGVWRGWGWDYLEHVPTTISIDTRFREWDLFKAPLSSMDTAFFRFSGYTANLFWCDDPEWWVTTDIDLDTTYIGGDRRLIKEVLESSALEAVSISVDDSL